MQKIFCSEREPTEASAHLVDFLFSDLLELPCRQLFEAERLDAVPHLATVIHKAVLVRSSLGNVKIRTEIQKRAGKLNALAGKIDK